ncbi:uncharacterized protein LOC128157391 [Crassostrea angulata]|uniref:uncharacterized protein LOC128157391 n=1 Tax=Magallana angulata TaxID=2784310 RepID=UPI0022B10689|nr:uncharacterized protein LOC128157391 [Crassostrea angulata]
MMSNQTLSIPYITPCWAKYLVIPGNTSIAMFSFAVFTILVFGIFKDCASSHKSHVNRDVPYDELIDRIQRYLALRQNDIAAPSTRTPDATPSPGPKPSPGPTPSPGTNAAGSTSSRPDTTHAPPGTPLAPSTQYPYFMNGSFPATPSSGPSVGPFQGNFSLDTNLHCPILTELLMRRVVKFPRTDDMTDSITVYPEKFRPLLRTAIKLLSFAKDPDVAALFLLRRFTRDVMESRLRCGTAKYQQVFIYAIIQEMKMLLQNNSVAGNIVASLQGFPRSQNLSQMIMNSVKGAIFNDLMDFAIKMEFGELDALVERFYNYVERRFREMIMHGGSRDTWAPNFLEEMRHFLVNQPGLQCTSLEKMKWNHAWVVNETKNGFLDMEQTGYIHRVGLRMLTRLASEFYGKEWPNYETTFPYDTIMNSLIGYTKQVMNVMADYERKLFNSPLNSIEAILSKYLAPGQQQEFRHIINFLTSPHPTPFPPSPYPSGSPTTDWNTIRIKVQESQSYLKRLLYMLESSTGSPDDMKKLVTEAVTRLDRLLSYLPSHTVV